MVRGRGFSTPQRRRAGPVGGSIPSCRAASYSSLASEKGGLPGVLLARSGRFHAPTARAFARWLLLVAAYTLAGRLGLLLAFENSNVSPVWPPTGIALAGLLWLGPRAWTAVALGAFLVNFLSPVSWFTACGIAAGNTLEAVAAVWLLGRAGFDTGLARIRDVLALLLLAAVGSTLASATVGVTSLCLEGAALWPTFGRLWWQWWLGDAMGDLVLVPLLLSWRTRPSASRGRRPEAAALVATCAVVSWTLFGGGITAGVFSSPYWIFPFLTWAALRFAQRGVSSITLLISALAIGGALGGVGPFIGATTAESLVLLQAFLGVTAVTGLFMAAVTAERQTAEAGLRRLNVELERRVIERTAELAEANSELGQRTEENETFVYSVSHDLRSPLVNLQGFSKELSLSSSDLRTLLSDPGVPAPVRERGVALLDGEVAESLRFIGTGVARLGDIIDSLLRLSRLRRVVYVWQPLDLGAVVRQVVDAMRGTVAERGAEVRVQALPAVWGDRAAVEQLFANLIGNALNYLDPARSGRVEVGRLEGDSPRRRPGFQLFFVRDNGLGIPEAHQKKLFQAFQRLHPDRAPGSGLGLTIVRSIVERHGGEIWVESTAGAGSEFFVSLPTERPPERAPRAAPEVSDSIAVPGSDR